MVGLFSFVLMIDKFNLFFLWNILSVKFIFLFIELYFLIKKPSKSQMLFKKRIVKSI